MEDKDQPMKKMSLPRILSYVALCTLHSALLLTAGCEAIGAVLHPLVGELPVDAQYIPKEVPTLVFVENYRSPDEAQLDGDQIAHAVTDELKHATKLEMIDPDKLAPLREEDPTKFRAMTCQSVGRAVGAKQVIYIDLLESGVTGDISQSVVHANAVAQVKVIDVETGNTLWPADASHGTEMKAEADYDPNDNNKAQSMRTEMLASLSSRISKLFHRWKPDNPDEINSGG
jgi:hypothetical protein